MILTVGLPLTAGCANQNHGNNICLAKVLNLKVTGAMETDAELQYRFGG